jgi:lipid II:glycine glycyltransferase (peptidoglycan interpeptide bridge formation enzyme)
MPLQSTSQWAEFLKEYPDAHILQTPAWGELKSAFGWQAASLVSGGQHPALSGNAGAQVLFRRLPLGFSVAYIPRGPVSDNKNNEWFAWEPFWLDIDIFCHRRKAVFLKVEPDCWENSISDGEAKVARIEKAGFQRSQMDIQPARTLVVDLTGSEEQILGRMKQKTRYNIRLASRKEVVVSVSSDLDAFHRLMLLTGERDAFGVHSLEYYRRAYDLFNPAGQCEILIAEYKSELLAGLMVFAYGKRAWYFYGASSNRHRRRMPNYLLQWEAMRWARRRGCISYDLWGVPDTDENTLETQFTKRSDGLWGVYRFKRGFGGQLKRASGSWDRVYQPILYSFYRWWSKRRNAEISD